MSYFLKAYISLTLYSIKCKKKSLRLTWQWQFVCQPKNCTILSNSSLLYTNICYKYSFLTFIYFNNCNKNLIVSTVCTQSGLNRYTYIFIYLFILIIVRIYICKLLIFFLIVYLTFVRKTVCVKSVFFFVIEKCYHPQYWQVLSTHIKVSAQI